MGEPVQLYYRPGDVGDGDRWEAVCDGVHGSGSTASIALSELSKELKKRDAVKED